MKANKLCGVYERLCWEILSGQVDKARKVIEGMVKTFMHLLPFIGMGVEGKIDYPLLHLFCEYSRIFCSAAPLFDLFLRCTDMLSKFPSRVMN